MWLLYAGPDLLSVPMLDEIRAGVPSHVTENLERVSFSDTEVREADER